MKYKILLDYREKELINSFQNHYNKNIDKLIKSNKKKSIEYEYENKNLLVGDINYEIDNKLVLIIERKTVNDLSQSIKDGRYREQKARMKATNAKIIYLIEKINTNNFHNLPFSTIMGSIVNNFLRDDIYVYQSTSINESSEFLFNILKKLDYLEPSVNNNSENINQEVNPQEKDENSYIQTVKVKKKDNVSGRNCFLAQLCTMPGISHNIAIAIHEKYNSWYDLIIAYMGIEEQYHSRLLEDIEINISNGKKRKLGKVLSARIYESIFGKENKN